MNILAPVVTLNAGQFLFKGQSRPLSSHLNLYISDEDNLASWNPNSSSARKFFTPDDLDAGVSNLIYLHFTA